MVPLEEVHKRVDQAISAWSNRQYEEISRVNFAYFPSARVRVKRTIEGHFYFCLLLNLYSDSNTTKYFVPVNIFVISVQVEPPSICYHINFFPSFVSVKKLPQK